MNNKAHGCLPGELWQGFGMHTRKDREFLQVEVKLHVTATGADSWRSGGGGCSGLGGGRERGGFGQRLTT